MILKIEIIVGLLGLICAQIGLNGIYGQLLALFGFAPLWNLPVLGICDIPFCLAIGSGAFIGTFAYNHSRWFWLVAMVTYAVLALVANALFALGKIPPDNLQFSFAQDHLLMHLGWVAFLPLIHSYFLEHSRRLHE